MPLVVCEADAAFDRWDELHGLLARNFAYMDGRIDPPSSLVRMRPGDLAAKAREETLILAMDGDTLAGCVFLKLEPDCGYIGKLAVDKAYRGRGLARRLLAVAEDVAARNGRTALRLQTRVELIENHATFARLGFTQTETTAHAGYHRPTSVTMRKTLSVAS